MIKKKRSDRIEKKRERKDVAVVVVPTKLKFLDCWKGWDKKKRRSDRIEEEKSCRCCACEGVK